jgi:hypothetical protein
VRTDWAGLGCPADVAMVKATDFSNGDDPTECGPLNRTAIRCILVEREVSARPVIVREVAHQGAAQVLFAKHDDMVETLAPDRAEERSAKGLCHGLCGAVRTSLMPMPFTRLRNAWP